MSAPTISAKQVKELRDRTGAGMMDCKNALMESGGDIEAAVELLRVRLGDKALKGFSATIPVYRIDAMLSPNGRRTPALTGAHA